MEYIIFDGIYNMVPDETASECKDEPLKIMFDRPQTVLWQSENWFCADIRVEQYSDVRIQIAFQDISDNKLMIEYELLPNVRVSFRVKLDELWSKRFFLEVFPGSYKGTVHGLPMDPQNVVKIEISVIPGKDFKSAELGKVWISEKHPDGINPDVPIIDEMGQLIGYEWSTKTHSFEEMKNRLCTEYEEAKANDCLFPNRSRWGGFLEKQFSSTGWFRVQHDGNRWWLVDPDGYAFFSHGLCYGTRMGEFGWYTGMEKFYENAPSPEDPGYEEAFTHPGMIDEYVKRYGVTERSNEWMYNPARGNMIRIFGEKWWDAWRLIATRRFHEWGINTTGVGIVNFTDEHCDDFLRMSNLPYVVTLKRFPTTKNFIFRDFPDVFSNEYIENSKIFAENELGPHANNHNLIGYFLHNEPEWMFESDCNIAWELLVENKPLKSRENMMTWLKERYGDIESFNASWGLDLNSFERLLRPLDRNTVLSDRGWKDLEEYEQILIDRFGSIPMSACKKISPNHLCLGMRYAQMNQKVLMSCKVFDVVSFNCYSKTPEKYFDLARVTEKPMIIGEWHFGAPDSGLLRTGILGAVSQEERAKAYRRYCEISAADPNCVGIHYFEYNNQTLMGRFDGEHAAHGIIDCCNLPYPLMVEAMKISSSNLYSVMTGQKAPYDGPVRYLEKAW